MTHLFTSPFPEHIGFFQSTTIDERIDDVELALLSPRAVQKRRDEFIRGRLAARGALRALGEIPVPILRNEDGRSPRWPDGIVGSITHTEGVALAAVARTDTTSAIGMDLERFDTASSKVSKVVARPEELPWILECDEATSSKRVVTLFSIKETTYKLLYPRVLRYFGFQEACVECSPSGSFTVTITERLSELVPKGFTFSGSFQYEGSLVLTAAWLS